MRWQWFTARRIAILAGLVILAFIAKQVFERYYVPPAPVQPIPFSHNVHVTTKKLSCFFCHPYATQSSNAGMPSVDKCYLCHRVIASKFRPVAQVVEYKNRTQPIRWQRVHVLPDFVRFSHQAHLTRRFDCGECHGNVAQMDRVRLQQRLDMNFCITCHWRNKASDNCFVCHY